MPISNIKSSRNVDRYRWVIWVSHVTQATFLSVVYFF